MSETCPECGAIQSGPLRIYGAHYSFCGFFSAQAYLEDQRADAEAWAEDARTDDPPRTQDDHGGSHA